MDWTTLLNYVLGGTSLLSIVAAIIYRRQNHRLKDNEVKKDDVETQKKEMELAEMYKDKVVELIEQLGHKQDSGNQNQTKILGKLNDLDKRMGDLDNRVDGIVTYLNGGYQDYLKKQQAPAKPKARRAQKPSADAGRDN